MTTTRGHLNDVAGLVVPLTGVLFALFLASAVALRKQVPLLTAIIGQFSSSRNDVGFVLLHHGLIDEAAEILGKAVVEGEDGVFALSNLAVCQALKGNTTVSDRMNKAAEFWARSTHSQAVVQFNLGIQFLHQGKIEESLAKIENAIRLSPRQIKKYCEHSVHLEKLRTNTRFHQLLKDT